MDWKPVERSGSDDEWKGAKTACSGGRPVLIIGPRYSGGIAQLVERLVRNEKARGSNPLTSRDNKTHAGNIRHRVDFR
jgi:hypothetical protein